MTSKMTSKERVIRTLQCKETDRIPIFDVIRCDAVAEYFSGMKFGAKADPVADEKLMIRALDSFVSASKSFIKLPADPGIRMVNGVETEFDRWTSWQVKPEEYDYNTASAKAEKLIREYDERRRNAREIAAKSWKDYQELSARFENTVFFHCIPPMGAGLYTSYCDLGGLDHLSYLIMDDEDLAYSMLEGVYQASLAFLRELPKDYAPVAALDAEDIAFKTGTIFSHDFLRKHLFPRLKVIVSMLNERGVPVLFHSDGDLRMVLDDIVDCGFIGNHPIETLASMDVGEIRKKYPKFVMCGGIDCSQLLPFGTPEDVYRTTCDNIEKTDHYGYFVGSSSEINDKIPPENIVAMLKAVDDMSK